MLNAKPLLNVITVQPKDFIDECRTLGSIKITDPTKCSHLREPDGFQIPYGWMINQLENNVVNYPNEQHPIWLWLRDNDIYRKSLSNDYMIIYAQIPLERCLVSDFMDWHAVLNNWHAGEDSDVDRDYSQTEIIASWDTVLVKDFDPLSLTSRDITYQACIDRIDFSEIIRIISAKDFKFEKKLAKKLWLRLRSL